MRPLVSTCETVNCQESCFKCRRRLYSRARQRANKDKVNAYNRNWAERNRAKVRAGALAWHRNNPEQSKALQRAWRNANPGKCAAYCRAYQAAKLGATPKWLNEHQKQQITTIYDDAALIGQMYETELHVDHIIPLQGENVCGLHVPWNLEILNKFDNLSKGNKF